MMYEKLMKIENEEDREMLQYEIYGLLMRPQRFHPTAQYHHQSQHHISEPNVAMYAFDTHSNGRSSVGSAIASAMSSSPSDGFSDFSSYYNRQEYYQM